MWVALDMPLPADDPAAVLDSYQGDWWTSRTHGTDICLEVLPQWIEYHHARAGHATPVPQPAGYVKPYYTWARQIDVVHT